MLNNHSPEQAFPENRNQKPRPSKTLEYPDLLSPEERVRYQKDIWGVSTTTGTLAVLRTQGRGLRYARINGRIYYNRKDVDLHFQHAQYIETTDSRGAMIAAGA